MVGKYFEENNITREMIEEYQHYLIYEKILPDWFAGNKENSRFSLENLGDFTVVDNTFAELGADWGI